MMGTRGVPALYGGFETAVEEIGERLVARGHEVTVYSRNRNQNLQQFNGMRLINLPALRLRHAETLSHATLSAAYAIARSRPDVAILFNAANAPLVSLLHAAGIPVAVHVDGLEWKRDKWQGAGARYFRWAEREASLKADIVIADAVGIVDHLREAYGRQAVFIPYGAHVITPGYDQLSALSLTPGAYHLVVARFEPENHVREVVEGFLRSDAKLPLAVVGSAPYSRKYTLEVERMAATSPRVRLLGGVWDQQVLDQLYGNCFTYLHGHSVGGTNPSLLRAMGAKAPVTAYDVVFNREVTAGIARFFSTPAEVRLALEADEADPSSASDRGSRGQSHVASSYRWDDVTDGYERLCRELQVRSRRSRNDP